MASETTYTAAEDQFILDNAGVLTWREIGKRLGRSRHQVRGRHLHLKEQASAPPKPGKGDGAFEATGRSYKVEQKGDDEQVVTSVDDRIKSPDELIAARGIDLKVWKVKHASCGQYEGFFRDKSFPVSKAGKDHWHRTAQVVQLYTVKVTLERRTESEKNNAKLREQLLADMREAAPQPFFINRPSTRGEFLYEMGPADHHFGKLCWSRETGENFDLKIATADFNRAYDDLLGRVSGMPVEKVLLVLGNDLLHVDNAENTTTAGTRQDADGRWQKSFLEAKRAIVENVEKCRQVAPVHIVIVPGNHDFQRMFYMGDTLDSWFHRFDDVTVDNSPMSRKYVEYGPLLLGLAHGCDEKDADYKDLMANEAPDAWARCRHREWHLGHLHAKKEKVYNKGDTHGGVHVRRLPSLTRTDAWHFRMGYVGNEHASEAYLWHRELGYYGHFSHSAEPHLPPRRASVSRLGAAA